MKAFQRAFNEVWDRVLSRDRRLMLDYWRSSASSLDGRPLPVQRPLIQIVEVPSPPTPPPPACELLGYELTFPADFIVLQTADLPHEIASLLVQVFGYASGAHWRLIQELIEQPLARWAAGEGAGASERARNRKLNELEGNFLRAHQAAVAQQLGAWGFDGRENGEE
jgi:hypothetical protein